MSWGDNKQRNQALKVCNVFTTKTPVCICTLSP
jgi:hypothetical protein